MSEANKNISRIRELVLGNNIAEIENRFLKLDQQFTFLLEEAETKWNNKLSESDQKNASILQKAISEISKEQKQSVNLLKDELEETKNIVLSLKEQLDTVKAELAILSEKQETMRQEFTARLDSEMTSIKKYWNEKLADLQLNKIDRSAMAVLLSELALNLSDQNKEENNEDNNRDLNSQ